MVSEWLNNNLYISIGAFIVLLLFVYFSNSSREKKRRSEVEELKQQLQTALQEGKLGDFRHLNSDMMAKHYKEGIRNNRMMLYLAMFVAVCGALAIIYGLLTRNDGGNTSYWSMGAGIVMEIFTTLFYIPLKSASSSMRKNLERLETNNETEMSLRIINDIDDDEERNRLRKSLVEKRHGLSNDTEPLQQSTS